MKSRLIILEIDPMRYTINATHAAWNYQTLLRILLPSNVNGSKIRWNYQQKMEFTTTLPESRSGEPEF